MRDALDQGDGAGNLYGGILRVSQRCARGIGGYHFRVAVGLAVAEKVQGPAVVTAAREPLHPRAAAERKVGRERRRKRCAVNEENGRRPIAGTQRRAAAQGDRQAPYAAGGAKLGYICARLDWSVG